MNPVIFWLILLVVFILIEVATMGLTTIWFAGGALIAVICALAGLPVYLQTAVFLTVSVVLLGFTRPIAARYFNQERVKTNVEGLAGSKGIVLTEINNLKGTGQVSLNGMEWSARAVDDERIIPAGAVVIVEEVSGVKLMVKEEGEE
jgi:membrane protein implicated in regulation of membrane protease activity